MQARLERNHLNKGKIILKKTKHTKKIEKEKLKTKRIEIKNRINHDKPTPQQ